MPLVSIIIPTYNRANLLPKAIKSVLNQAFKDFELIIIDDGSTDNTKGAVSQFSDHRVFYYKNSANLGIQKSLNRGIKLARGIYIARIDDDDEWIDRDKLRKQVDFLSNNRDYVLIGTGAVFVDENNKEILRFLNSQSDAEIRQRLLGKNCFIHSSVMFCKKAALCFGGYDDSARTNHADAEDYDLWLKLGSIGKFANLPIYGIKFTVHSDSLSARNKVTQMKKNIYLTKEYKDIYPNYFLSLLKGYARLLIYGYLNLRFVSRISAYFKK